MQVARPALEEKQQGLPEKTTQPTNQPRQDEPVVTQHGGGYVMHANARSSRQESERVPEATAEQHTPSSQRTRALIIELSSRLASSLRLTCAASEVDVGTSTSCASIFPLFPRLSSLKDMPDSPKGGRRNTPRVGGVHRWAQGMRKG